MPNFWTGKVIVMIDRPINHLSFNSDSHIPNDDKLLIPQIKQILEWNIEIAVYNIINHYLSLENRIISKSQKFYHNDSAISYRAIVMVIHKSAIKSVKTCLYKISKIGTNICCLR